MTCHVVNEDDLAALAAVFPDLDFTDAERRAALLECRTRDVHAAPGSGKTTLLAAKLYLLLTKWPHERRGICVISHTKVAGEEISRRLLATRNGARLFSYPHFIGTIQAFVDKFLALPLLRTLEIPVDVIDNDTFAKKALWEARRFNKLRFWLEKQPNRATPVISTLSYHGSDLRLDCLNGKMLLETAASYHELTELKKRLTQQGVHMFEDMFAYADALLDNFPFRRERLSHRFPIVLIDEMQDTSWSQEDLLSRLFDETVVMQRFGDQNQRILSSSKDSEKLTFPLPDYLSISTSKRFPKAIASAASAVQLTGSPIVGQGLALDIPPTLLLYATKAVERVIPHFGRLVLCKMPHELLTNGAVKAICTRKQGEANQAPGRHLGDYWPAIAVNSSDGSTNKNLASVLLSGLNNAVGIGLGARVSAVRRVIMLALRESNSKFGKDVRDGTWLLRALEMEGIDTTEIRLVIRELALGRNLAANKEVWSNTITSLFKALQPLLPSSIDADSFATLPLFELSISDDVSPMMRECFIEYNGGKVEIQVGTVAAAKGETHLATLVLESHGGHSRKFDISMAMSNLCGAAKVDPLWNDLVKGQYRNMYVAMSRPSHMLCIAINKERAPAAHVDQLIALGWDVQEVT